LVAQLWIRLEITSIVDTIQAHCRRISNPCIMEFITQEKSIVVIDFINFYNSSPRSVVQSYENKWEELTSLIKQREPHSKIWNLILALGAFHSIDTNTQLIPYDFKVTCMEKQPQLMFDFDLLHKGCEKC
jgi:hypothetical protein